MYNRTGAIIRGNCFAFCGVTSVFPWEAWRVHEAVVVSIYIVIVEETVCCIRTTAIIRMCKAAGENMLKTDKKHC